MKKKQINIDKHIRRRVRVIEYFKKNGAEDYYIDVEMELITLLRELKARREMDAKKD